MEKGNKGENDALCFGNMPPTIEYGGGGKPPLYRLRGIRMTTLQRTRNGIVVHTQTQTPTQQIHLYEGLYI